MTPPRARHPRPASGEKAGTQIAIHYSLAKQMSNGPIHFAQATQLTAQSLVRPADSHLHSLRTSGFGAPLLLE